MWYKWDKVKFVDLTASGQDSAFFSGSQKKAAVSVRGELPRANMAVNTVTR